MIPYHRRILFPFMTQWYMNIGNYLKTVIINHRLHVITTRTFM